MQLCGQALPGRNLGNSWPLGHWASVDLSVPHCAWPTGTGPGAKARYLQGQCQPRGTEGLDAHGELSFVFGLLAESFLWMVLFDGAVPAGRQVFVVVCQQKGLRTDAVLVCHSCVALSFG